MFCVEAGVVFSPNLFVLTIGETECYITATKISQPGRQGGLVVRDQQGGLGSVRT